MRPRHDHGCLMLKNLLIVVVEADTVRAQSIADGLAETGDHDIRIVAKQSSLARRVAELRPDVVLIDIADPSRDILEDWRWPGTRPNVRSPCSWTGPTNN